MKDLVLRYMGEQEAVKRSVLTVSSVTQDADGLKKLIVSLIIAWVVITMQSSFALFVAAF